jgi:phytoene dehydrogenase-like protein
LSIAVVIGAGHNGLVAANLLADAGWDVEVLEAQPEPGGATRSGEVVEPGFVHDRFSSFYPFAAWSPIIRGLELERFGLRFRRGPLAMAHPDREGRCVVLSVDRDRTAASVERFAPGDGEAWHELMGLWDRVADAIAGVFFAPFPPVRGPLRLARRLPPPELLRFARFGLLPVRRMGEEWFRGEGGRLLLAGNALHADLPPEAPGSGAFGWLMAGLGDRVGWPGVEGGASGLVRAMIARLEARGGRVRCGVPVDAIEVRGGRAVAVRAAGGERVAARRAVLADVPAPALYERLLAPADVPARVRADLRRFQYDDSTFKVDWTLDGPIPWTAEEAGQAGTVHLSDSVDDLSRQANELVRGLIPGEPFLLLGQYAVVDPTRQPPGCDTAWAYTHVPQVTKGDAAGDGLTGDWRRPEEAERFADRMEAVVEARAPGFRQRIRARRLHTPGDLQDENPNLVGGAINGGVAMLHQVMCFRPIPAHLGRAATPIRGLYLASASAHPAGGVHGAPGANAARAALAAAARRRAGLAAAGAALATAAVRR